MKSICCIYGLIPARWPHTNYCIDGLSDMNLQQIKLCISYIRISVFVSEDGIPKL